MLNFFSIVFVFCFVVSCASSEKRAQKNLEEARTYFQPLNDYRSLTCDMRVHLPESFKALKRGELKGEKLKAWNAAFDEVEAKAFTWTLAAGNCQVRGVDVLKSELKNRHPRHEEELSPFIESLGAQLRVGSCILLQALYYHSPLEGLKLERFKLEPKDKGGVALLSDNGKSEIHWYPESKSLSSKSANGEVFMASYENEGELLKITRAALMGSSHQLSLEDIKFKSLQNRRLIVEEYILSLEDRSGRPQPQARVGFENCVTRIRPLGSAEDTP